MARINLTLPESFPFATEEKIRITDLNYGNHLANDSILSIIHEARVRFLDKYKISEMNIFGVGLILSDSVIVYKSEGFYGNTLVIDVAVSDFTKVGCDIYYKLSNKESGKEIARAKTGIVFFDYSKRKVVSVPEKFKELFSNSIV